MPLLEIGASAQRLSLAVVGFTGVLMLALALNSRSGGETPLRETIHEDRPIAGRPDSDFPTPQIATHGTVSANEQQIPETDAMLTVATAATEQYRDVDRALADGYQPVTGVLTGSAMHFVSQSALEDAGFEVTRPEVLLYDDIPGGSLELVGVAYLLPQQSAHEPPPEDFGPLAHWHAHHYRWPCLTVRTEGPPVTIDRGDEACRAAGDIVFAPRFWMLHVWLFRASPDGIFSELNSTVGASERLVEGAVK